MRFINLDGRTPKRAWLKKAERLNRQLNNAADEVARMKLIEDNDTVWKELRPWLRGIT